MRLASELETEAIMEIVDNWWEENEEGLSNYMNSTTAKDAVAEFCANQEGITFYKERTAGYDEEAEKKKAEGHMAKWSEASDKIQSKVVEAVTKSGQEKCHVFYSAYKLDEEDLPIDNLDEIAVEGNVVFVESGDTFFGNGKGYESDVFYNPTWLDVAVVANEMIVATGDFHHIFLEGVIKTPKEEVNKTVRFMMGS